MLTTSGEQMCLSIYGIYTDIYLDITSMWVSERASKRARMSVCLFACRKEVLITCVRESIQMFNQPFLNTQLYNCLRCECMENVFVCHCYDPNQWASISMGPGGTVYSFRLPCLLFIHFYWFINYELLQDRHLPFSTDLVSRLVECNVFCTWLSLKIICSKMLPHFWASILPSFWIFCFYRPNSRCFFKSLTASTRDSKTSVSTPQPRNLSLLS